ncbi:hypothetical protein AMECASPLE_014409, partial [Ameca splendens]
IQLPGRRETTNKAFSSQDECTPGKEEEIGKDGAVWTVVGEEESRGRSVDRAPDPRFPDRIPLLGGCRNAHPRSGQCCG